ncbi:MAG TPA: hypothetical protein VIF15_03370 [Polyangiaceae bacterium]|jgi:hypothetical protein
MADANWPVDTVNYPNAFSGVLGGGPLLNHQHVSFAVPNPDDLDGSGNVRAGAMLTITNVDPSLPVGCVVVYVFDGSAWPHFWGPQVVALAPYPGPPGAPLTVQTTMTAAQSTLRPIAIESLQAWRDWVAGWAAMVKIGGGPGNQGDGNAHP